MSNGDRQLLSEVEAFVLDNAELDRLESLVDEFNPFAAMRWTRQETRHSTFLRWALDPNETHGQGPVFLRPFLKQLAVLMRGRANAPSVVDVDCWDLSNAEVITEWNSIDLLIRCDEDRFVAVIENKVESTEHSNQLSRYREVVDGHYPSHTKLFCYLTIDGETPSDDVYVNLNYSDIAQLLEKVARQRQSQLSEPVRQFVDQYVQMVRRHIVADSEIQRLCEKIYAKHARAIDTILEYRPDRAQQVAALLRRLIAEIPELEEDYSIKSYARFTSKNMDRLPKTGAGWTKSGRLVLYEIVNTSNKVGIKLTLGPGELNARQQVHAMVVSRPEVFNKSKEKLYPQFWTFHLENWINPKEYDELDLKELEGKIRSCLQKFVTEKIPKIEAAFAPLLQ